MKNSMSSAEEKVVEEKAGSGRVWCDGCYDLTHFGHANSLRQAKALGKYLVVGVHSDAAIEKNKGCLPVLSEQDRYTMVRALKWVDKVVEDAPYMTTVETLDKHECDFCAHGDDISTNVDGKDTYQEVKDAGRYQVYKRTQGVSTTDLIDRILNLGDQVNENCGDADGDCKSSCGNHKECQVSVGGDIKTAEVSRASQSPWTGKSLPFLATATGLRSFTEGMEPPQKNDKIVYVPGAFDLLHPGHLAFLEKARNEGNYLIVGLYSDETVKEREREKENKGRFPIMNLIERSHSLLALKCVSDVVLAPPYLITEELLQHFNIKVVAHGKGSHLPKNPEHCHLKQNGTVFLEIDTNCNLTTKGIIEKILSNRKIYEERNAKKEKKEANILMKKKEKKEVGSENM